MTLLRIAVAEREGTKDDCLAASDELTDDRWTDREGAVVRVGVMTFPGGRIEDGAHREVLRALVLDGLHLWSADDRALVLRDVYAIVLVAADAGMTGHADLVVVGSQRW